MKKLLYVLLILSIFMFSCKGDGAMNADKTHEDKEASQELVDDKADEEESASNPEPEVGTEEEAAEADYKVLIDGKDYGTVHSLDGKLFNFTNMNEIYVKYWKQGKYAQDRALDNISDYTRIIDEDQLFYGAFPESNDFYKTYNKKYNISYDLVLDTNGDCKEFRYRTHKPGDAKVIDDQIYFSIDYLKNIFAFEYKIDNDAKELKIDSDGDYADDIKTISGEGYKSLDDLLKFNFGK